MKPNQEQLYGKDVRSFNGIFLGKVMDCIRSSFRVEKSILGILPIKKRC